LGAESSLGWNDSDADTSTLGLRFSEHGRPRPLTSRQIGNGTSASRASPAHNGAMEHDFGRGSHPIGRLSFARGSLATIGGESSVSILRDEQEANSSGLLGHNPLMFRAADPGVPEVRNSANTSAAEGKTRRVSGSVHPRLPAVSEGFQEDPLSGKVSRLEDHLWILAEPVPSSDSRKEHKRLDLSSFRNYAGGCMMPFDTIFTTPPSSTVTRSSRLSVGLVGPQLLFSDVLTIQPLVSARSERGGLPGCVLVSLRLFSLASIPKGHCSSDGTITGSESPI